MNAAEASQCPSAAASAVASDAAPRIFVLGTGAVGLPLAGFLTLAGKSVVAVRMSEPAAPAEKTPVTIRMPEQTLKVAVQTAPLSALGSLDGIVVVATKSYANPAVAATLEARHTHAPLILLQNGVGVEAPFIEAKLGPVYRGVLYVTSQAAARGDITFRAIASCPLGLVRGSPLELAACVAALTTPQFSFHAEASIAREVWKKAVVNAVFNSICPLLDVDNGIFARDTAILALAQEIVGECVTLAATQGAALSVSETMEQILRISRGSQGVAISTLQDIRHGRETEIETLNLAMARLASAATPRIDLAKTELLGRLIRAKSRCARPPTAAASAS